jgi:hypothetical protein
LYSSIERSTRRHRDTEFIGQDRVPAQRVMDLQD